MLLHVGVLFGLQLAAPSYTEVRTSLSARLASPDTAPLNRPAAPRHIIPTFDVAGVAPVSLPLSYTNETPLDHRIEATPTDIAANADGTYFAAEQLDTPPRMVGEVHQDYPAIAHSKGIEGYATLKLLINEHGEVDEISVIASQPRGYFEDAAKTMLGAQRFMPALKHNQAVKSHVLSTVRYRLL